MALCAYYPFFHWLSIFTKNLPIYRTLVFLNFRQCLDDVSYLFEVLIHSFKACKNFNSVAIREYEIWQNIFHYEIALSSLVTIAYLANNGILHAIDRLLVNRFQKNFFEELAWMPTLEISIHLKRYQKNFFPIFSGTWPTVHIALPLICVFWAY